MKVVIDLAAAAPVSPDYAMLKAALLAAQAGTPTARSCRDAVARPAPYEALERLFTAAEGLPGAAIALEHRFARAALPAVDGE